MLGDPSGEIFRKPSELVGLVPLMLRWPFLCFRKICLLMTEVTNIEDVGRYVVPPKYYLAPYLAYREVHLPDEEEVLLACLEFNRHSGTYAEHLKKIPQLYFLKEDVVAAENLFRDLRQTDEGYHYKEPRLLCVPGNIGELAQITLFHILNFPYIYNFMNFKRFSEFWEPAVYETKELELPPEGLIRLTPQELWPRWPADGPAAPRKPEPERIRDFIAVRLQQGQTDAAALALEIDERYPGLTDGQMGALLPAELFPAHGGPRFRNFQPGLYDTLSPVSAAANRKRGQRLRGKTK